MGGSRHQEQEEEMEREPGRHQGSGSWRQHLVSTGNRWNPPHPPGLATPGHVGDGRGIASKEGSRAWGSARPWLGSCSPGRPSCC